MNKNRKQKEPEVHEVKNVEVEMAKNLSYSERLLKERETVMKVLGIEKDFMTDEINKELE
jgi:hypothetical protein